MPDNRENKWSPCFLMMPLHINAARCLSCLHTFSRMTVLSRIRSQLESMDQRSPKQWSLWRQHLWVQKLLQCLSHRWYNAICRLRLPLGRLSKGGSSVSRRKSSKIITTDMLTHSRKWGDQKKETSSLHGYCQTFTREQCMLPPPKITTESLTRNDTRYPQERNIDETVEPSSNPHCGYYQTKLDEHGSIANLNQLCNPWKVITYVAVSHISNPPNPQYIDSRRNYVVADEPGCYISIRQISIWGLCPSEWVTKHGLCSSYSTYHRTIVELLHSRTAIHNYPHRCG